MSAVRTMQSLSLLSSLKAKFWALVRLGFGGWEDLRTLLTSALSSSASCWLSLVQAASMAVMYPKLGGCLGDTAKLGPLARTDLWAGVKGLLDRLMTHFGLGSWGPLGKPIREIRCGVAFPGTSTVCLGGSAVPLGSLEGPLPGSAPGILPAWTACLTWGGLLPAWEGFSPARVFVVASLPAWEEVQSPFLGGNCLSCCC